MSLVSDIIDLSFNDLGVTRPGETITGAVQTQAFSIFQKRWALNSLDQTFTSAWYHQVFTVTAGTATYTVGTGGSLVATADPIRITGWRSQSGGFSNGGTPISFEQFEANVKDPLSTSSVVVQVLAADGAVPSKNIRIFPVPAASPGTLTLDYFAAMVALSSVGQTLSFGPGYEDFMHNDLAIALYPQYARAGGLSLQALQANRENALAIIRGLNASIQQLGAAPQQAA